VRSIFLVCVVFVGVVATIACAPDTPVFPTPPSPAAGAPASLELDASSRVGANAGQATLTVRVLDAYATPVKGASIVLETTSGTVTPSTLATDDNGRGTATLQARAGTVTVTAKVSGTSLTNSTIVAVQ